MTSKQQALVNELNKKLGRKDIKLGSDPSLEVKYLPTGVLPIDYLLKGGIPIGRMTEVFGSYSTLKSFVALKSIATTQQQGGIAALIDTEHSYDPVWLKQLGGDPDTVIVEQPDYGEAAISVTEVLVRSGIKLVVWDSVAATITKNSSEKSSEDDVQPARLAQFMSRALPRLTAANKGTTALLWVNQTRANIGMTFGPTETTPGGRALPFYSSYRLKFAPAGRVTEDVQIWDGDKYVTSKQRVAMKIRASLEKSKLNSPDREVWFQFDLKTASIDDKQFLVTLGLESGHIVNNGASWSINGRSVRGKDKFKASLTDKDITWLATKLGLSIGMPSRGVRKAVVKKAVTARKR